MHLLTLYALITFGSNSIEILKLKSLKSNTNNVLNSQQIIKLQDNQKQNAKPLFYVTISSKYYEFYKYKTPAIEYTLYVKNLFTKEIRAFKGKITIYNWFDDKIQSFNVVFEEKVPAHNPKEPIIFPFFFTHVEPVNLSKLDMIIINGDLSKFKIVWTTEKVVFMDGTVKTGNDIAPFTDLRAK